MRPPTQLLPHGLLGLACFFTLQTISATTEPGVGENQLPFSQRDTKVEASMLRFPRLMPGSRLAECDNPRALLPRTPVIPWSDSLQVTISETQSILCAGDSTGTLIADVLHGRGPYTFLWSDGVDQPTNTGLTAGTYSVTVTDADGVQAESSFTLTEPAALAVTTIADATCRGTANSTVIVRSAGGTPPYSYQWSTGATADTLFMLPVGTYFVTTTDANGCMDTSAARVFEIPLPEVTFEAGEVEVPVDLGPRTGLGGGLPVGGIYSGPGITDDGNGETYTFDPTGLELGETTVTYTFKDPVSGCFASAEDVITVLPGLDGCRLEQKNREIGLLINDRSETGQQFVACTTGRLTEILLFSRDDLPFSATLKLQRGPFPTAPAYTQEIDVPAGDSIIIQLDTGFNVLQDTLYSFALLSRNRLFGIRGTMTDVDRVFGGRAIQNNAKGEYLALDQFAVAGRLTIEADSTVVSTRTPRAAVAEMIAYPNPARGSFTVAYTLVEATELELVLFGARGQLLRQQRLGRQLAGENTLRVDAANLPAGIIAYGLRSSNGRMLVKRMVLME
ncbi:hypothetical protein [Lewinella sp. W8]|uniref:hypothetical protein n=1 Tax=Lewinella sp. W8 TaxID=2528208 RepID=UPI00106756F3|nr:hypothetical protein [Lewinella sp. W8]MTB53319.1 hypothetical protein [Lewinella sp. W8]